MRTRIGNTTIIAAGARAVAPFSLFGQDGDAQRSVENGLRRAIEVGDSENPSFSIAERMDYYDVPGLSLAVVDNGEVDWAAGYGVIESGTRDYVSDRVLFQAASVSKALVAVAAMRLRDAGLIDLDENVSSYLTEFALPNGEQSPGNPVTFRNLLSHTSGITPGGYFGYARGDPIPTDVQVLRGESPANSEAISVDAPPGTRVAYSGGGYTLIEQAMQETLGKPIELIMDEWVLSPLELRHSTFRMLRAEPPGMQIAAGHSVASEPVQGGWRIHPEQAAAGMWSTAYDLAVFAAEIGKAYQGQSDFMSRSTAVELLTEQMDGEAVGLVVSGEGDELTFQHAGGNVGYSAFMVMHPVTGDGAALMTNSDSGGRALINEVLRAVSAVYDWPDYKPEIIDPFDVRPDELERLAGRYEFDLGRPQPAVVEAVFESNGLDFGIVFPNGDIYRLTATGPRSFVHVDTGVTVGFEGEAGNEAMLLYGDRGLRQND